jgi:hypothetical protein
VPCCSLRLPLDTAPLALKAGLFPPTHIKEVLPGVGILVKKPFNTNSVIVKDLKARLKAYGDKYYDQESRGHELSPGHLSCDEAWNGLTWAGVEFIDSGSTEEMDKTLRGTPLDSDGKKRVETALGRAIPMPARQDGAETGTLQPPALGLGCSHRPVLR